MMPSDHAPESIGYPMGQLLEAHRYLTVTFQEKCPKAKKKTYFSAGELKIVNKIQEAFESSNNSFQRALLLFMLYVKTSCSPSQSHETVN